MDKITADYSLGKKEYILLDQSMQNNSNTENNACVEVFTSSNGVSSKMSED